MYKNSEFKDFEVNLTIVDQSNNKDTLKKFDKI